jgi:hypothetical protein
MCYDFSLFVEFIDAIVKYRTVDGTIFSGADGRDRPSDDIILGGEAPIGEERFFLWQQQQPLSVAAEPQIVTTVNAHSLHVSGIEIKGTIVAKD